MRACQGQSRQRKALGRGRLARPPAVGKRPQQGEMVLLLCIAMGDGPCLLHRSSESAGQGDVLPGDWK